MELEHLFCSLDATLVAEPTVRSLVRKIPKKGKRGHNAVFYKSSCRSWKQHFVYFFLLLELVFRTYSKVEISPGPGLNVVVGANGTGKSTIVCGICLGLGGKPGILGRASSVTEYIKHGKTTAVIEIEL